MNEKHPVLPVADDDTTPPPRFNRPKWWQVLTALGLLTLLSHAFYGTEFSTLTWAEIGEMPSNILRLLNEMFPPSPAPLPAIGRAVVETIQMSLVGTVLGVLCSLPLGFAAARSLTPNRFIYFAARGLISFCRTVPDMVWAIFFVIIVGLGPLAGMLTLLVDTIGFAGRFFAEAFEDTDPGPTEALTAIGASRKGAFFSSTLPAAFPSCTNTCMFSMERAVQSSVVLGLVGAGGIGMLIEEPMTWHNYNEATTVVLTIFLMLACVEQISAYIRRRIIA
jgi:phosphonate transport system permease protein